MTSPKTDPNTIIVLEIDFSDLYVRLNCNSAAIVVD